MVAAVVSGVGCDPGHVVGWLAGWSLTHPSENTKEHEGIQTVTDHWVLPRLLVIAEESETWRLV